MLIKKKKTWKKLIGVEYVFDLIRLKVFPPNRVAGSPIKFDVHVSL